MGYKDKEQQRTYQRRWVAERRAGFFKDKCCVVCGSTDELELDHIDRATKVTHNIWSWSEGRRQEELAKCQVLCAYHHLVKTVRENTKHDHGIIGTYKKGCRCDDCVEVNRERVRRQRR